MVCLSTVIAVQGAGKVDDNLDRTKASGSKASAGPSLPTRGGKKGGKK
jgi:hypothetical protein